MVLINQEVKGKLDLSEADECGEGTNDLEIQELRFHIRESILHHLTGLGINVQTEYLNQLTDEKERIRTFHSAQRCEYRLQEREFVARYGQKLLSHFANGDEVIPEAVDPVLSFITNPDSEDGRLFRLATLLWSVPVSRGYGRRMRFLVRDRSNGKLIGLFALADPVINLRARDAWIGWSPQQRRQSLVNVMDAHIVGAVPPYDRLLGGKLVASLMTSQEVCESFVNKYGQSRGIISGLNKHAQLVLITVTSALGRSSLYNRLKLPEELEFYKIGMTGGWGHFQVPDQIFREMRRLLELERHPYASGHKFGQGSNWKMRVAWQALADVDLDPGKLLRHGVAREIYAAPLASNWREFLCGQDSSCIVQRSTAEKIGRLVVSRWLLPRASRKPDFRDWTRQQTWAALTESGVPPINENISFTPSQEHRDEPKAEGNEQ
jgi:hypothetical protein